MFGNGQFYRKPLPPDCISFCSPEGRRIFAQAMSRGHMVCYFHLASQFRTQDEPAFCGLSTLVMVLNALSVDPGRVWKGPWRWYHEGMLDCCVPIHVAAKQGITLDQFTCIAQCNSLQVQTTRVDPRASLAAFRDLVKAVTITDDKALVCSYFRPALGQTGSGHFSPVGGYNPDEDLVLLLDVARFKYPPHWVKLSLLWDAMAVEDSETGLARGYCLMERFDGNGPPLLFTIAPPLCILLPKDTLPEVRRFVMQLETWHAREDGIAAEDILREAARACLLCFLDLPADVSLVTTEVNLSDLLMKTVSVEHANKIMSLVVAIEDTRVFACVTALLQEDEFAVLADRQTGRVATCTADCSPKGGCRPFYNDYNDNNTVKLCCTGRPDCVTLGQRHFVTMLILAASYTRSNCTSSPSANGLMLAKAIKLEMASYPGDLQIEIRRLRRQLRTCITYIGRTTQ